MVTHYRLYSNAVACGAHTSWESRHKKPEELNISMSAEPSLVTCKRCQDTASYRYKAHTL